MFKYFNMLESVASLDQNQYSICDLTKKIMLNAGYEKYDYTFKNGSIRQRVRYSGEFDNVLVAKWMLFYKDLFISKLMRESVSHLREYQVDIINRTFQSVFYSLDIDKIVDNNIVNKYFNMSLDSRIKEYLFIFGSEARLWKTNQINKPCMRLNTSVNHLAQMLDMETMNKIREEQERDIFEDCDFIVDLREKLQYNKFGDRLIEAMLGSNKKVQLYDIESYMPLSEAERTSENKKLILDAYNTIYGYVCKYTNKPYKKCTLSQIHFREG